MPTFCELLEKAITDEKEAIKGYQELEKPQYFRGLKEYFPVVQIDVEDINDLILEPIKKDEEKHLETLQKLNERICK